MASSSSTSPNLLIVVAHPDDESIWIGDLLCEFVIRGTTVTVLCLTNGQNGVRRAEFERATAFIGARSSMLDIPDRKYPPFPRIGAEQIEEGLRLSTFSASFDLVVTHGAGGDANQHMQHVDCHNAVREWAANTKCGFATFGEWECGTESQNTRLHIRSGKLTSPSSLGKAFGTDSAWIDWGVDLKRKQQLLTFYHSQNATITALKAEETRIERLLFQSEYDAENLLALFIEQG